MSLFLKKSLLFIAPLLLVFLVIEIPMHYWFSTRIGKPAEFRQIINHGDKTEILVVGDSHFAYLDVAAFSPNTQLFWNGALDLYNSSQIVEKIVAKSPKIRQIVLNLSFFSFANSNAIHHSKMLNDYFLIGIMPDRYIDVRNFSTLYSKREQAFNIFLSKIRPSNQTEVDTLGTAVVENEEKSVALTKHAKLKADEHGKTNVYANEHPNIYQDNLNYFRKIVEICKQRNIKLTVVVTPHSKYYLDSFPYVRDFYQNLEKVKSSDFEFHDFSKLYLDKDEMFRDSDHLSKNASAEFSQFLIQSKIVGNF